MMPKNLLATITFKTKKSDTGFVVFPKRIEEDKTPGGWNHSIANSYRQDWIKKHTKFESFKLNYKLLSLLFDWEQLKNIEHTYIVDRYRGEVKTSYLFDVKVSGTFMLTFTIDVYEIEHGTNTI